MLVALRRVYGKFDAAVARNAFKAAVLVGGINNVGVDLSVQAATRDRGEISAIDWRRASVFGAFGVVWIGGAQFMIFNRFLPTVLPGLLEGRLSCAIKAMIFDQAFHMPFMYLPVYYCIRELGESRQTLQVAVENAVKTWQTNVLSDSVVQLGLFVPFQLLNFTLIPPHFRVPSLVSFGLVWLSVLSYRRGTYQEAEEVKPSEIDRLDAWVSNFKDSVLGQLVATPKASNCEQPSE